MLGTVSHRLISLVVIGMATKSGCGDKFMVDWRSNSKSSPPLRPGINIRCGSPGVRLFEVSGLEIQKDLDFHSEIEKFQPSLLL